VTIIHTADGGTIEVQGDTVVGLAERLRTLPPGYYEVSDTESESAWTWCLRVSHIDGEAVVYHRAPARFGVQHDAAK
jgi:hypothetical protein